MKKIQCEACGSSNLVFQDGFLVCRSCDTKYLVTGIETPQKMQNYRILARRAYEEEDYVNAKKYYENILFDNPEDWEAYCYSKLSNLYMSNDKDMYDNISVFKKSIENIVRLIYKSSKDPTELVKTIKSANKDFMATSKNFFNKYYFGVDQRDIHKIRFAACGIAAKWNDEIYNQNESFGVDLGKSYFIENFKQLAEQYTILGRSDYDTVIDHLLDLIHEEEPNWNI